MLKRIEVELPLSWWKWRLRAEIGDEVQRNTVFWTGHDLCTACVQNTAAVIGCAKTGPVLSHDGLRGTLKSSLLAEKLLAADHFHYSCGH